MTTYTDKKLKCLCGEEFVWTAGEQKFMQTLFDNGKIFQMDEPKRCPPCRLKKKFRNKLK